MTSHELAKLLLSMPDLPVVVQDGGDPSDPVVVEFATLSHDRYYDGETGSEYKNLHIVLN